MDRVCAQCGDVFFCPIVPNRPPMTCSDDCRRERVLTYNRLRNRRERQRIARIARENERLTALLAAALDGHPVAA
jgi:hypothetical protein